MNSINSASNANPMSNDQLQLLTQKFRSKADLYKYMDQVIVSTPMIQPHHPLFLYSKSSCQGPNHARSTFFIRYWRTRSGV